MVIVSQACRLLPNPIETKICDLLVGPVVNAIYDAIEKHVHVTAKEICSDLRLCSAKTKTVKDNLVSALKDASKISDEVTSPSSVAVDPCELCLEIANTTIQIADSSASRAAAKMAIRRACKAIPNYFGKKVCEFVAGPIVDAIYDAIEAHVHITADEICTGLKLCSNSSSSSINNGNPPSLKDRLKAAIAEKKRSEVSTPNANPLECQVCQITMRYLQGYATEDNKKTMIFYFNNTICQKMDPSIRKNCSDDVVKIVEELFNIMETQTPLQICQTVQACDPSMTVAQSAGEVAQLVSSMTSFPSLKANPIECQTCQFMMRYIKGDATEKNRKFLIFVFNSTLCMEIKPENRQACSDDVVKIVDEIFNVMETQTPLQICQTVGACAASAVVAQFDGQVAEITSILSSSSSSSSPFQCKLCETAASVAKSFVTPENEQAALSFLEGALCGKLPASDRANCSEMLHLTVGNLFAMLNGMTPRRFCEQIAICGEENHAALFNADQSSGVVRMKGPLGVIECELCKYAAQTLSPHCAVPSNAEAIVDYLNSTICQRYVSPDQRPMCAGLVKNATLEIFKLVASGQICGKLGVCPESSAKKSSVNNDIECELCEYAAQTLAPYFSPANALAIVDYLNSP